MAKTFLPIHTAEFACAPGNVTINDLPDELIISIARFMTLRTSFDARSAPKMNLFRLATCSRRFYNLVEPVIYEDFYCGWSGSEKFLERFMRPLLARPDLARRVRSIHWEDILSRTIPVACFGVEGWKAARNRIIGLHESPTVRDAWDETAEEVGLEAIVALLFVLTPNLEELVLESYNPIASRPPVLRWMTALIRRLQLQKQLENPAALWKLRSVKVNMWATDGEDPNYLMQLMIIPSVEIFWAWSLDETVLRDFLHSNDLVLDNIKELNLMFDCIDPDILGQFLYRFPSLKRLHCSLDEPSVMESYPADLTFVPHFLELQLEELAIIDYAFLEADYILIQRKLKSLAPFKNLRILKTKWSQLVGQTDIDGDLADALFGQDIPETSRQIADVIPTSLERLQLQGHCNYAPAVISRLLGQKHRFPSLKYLDLGWQRTLYHDNLIPEDPHIHTHFSKAESLECLYMCREAGVEMVMGTTSRTRKTIT